MWRPTEADIIYRETPMSKGVANRARNRPGRPTWDDRPRSGSVTFRSPTLLGQLLTCSLLHVGPWRRLLHCLDRAPCCASFSIFCQVPRVLCLHIVFLGSFGVIFTSSVDLCQATWSSHKVVIELFPEVLLLVPKSCVNNIPQISNSQVNLLHH
jgi:hypothetical protein